MQTVDGRWGFKTSNKYPVNSEDSISTRCPSRYFFSNACLPLPIFNNAGVNPKVNAYVNRLINL